MQLNEAIKTGIGSVESRGEVLPSEIIQRTAQFILRQKVSWYVSPLPAPEHCYKPVCLLPGNCTASSVTDLVHHISSPFCWLYMDISRHAYCCRGKLPLPMEPSHTTTTKRSRLSLQPVCQKLPVGTTLYGNINNDKDPTHDTELEGRSMQRPLLKHACMVTSLKHEYRC